MKRVFCCLMAVLVLFVAVGCDVSVEGVVNLPVGNRFTDDVSAPQLLVLSQALTL